MGVLKCLGHLLHEVEGIALGNRTVGQQLPQAYPFHILHDQAVEVIRFVDVENRHDKRVPQLRERARLTEEPLLECIIGPEVGPDDLDGDKPVQERLASLVDDAHSALAQQFRHFQVGEARGQFRGRGRREPCLRMNHRLLAPDPRGLGLENSHGVESTICLGFLGSELINCCGWPLANSIAGPFI